MNVALGAQRASCWKNEVSLHHSTSMQAARKRVSLGWLHIGTAPPEVSGPHSLKPRVASVSSMHLVTVLDPSLETHSTLWEEKMCGRHSLSSHLMGLRPVGDRQAWGKLQSTRPRLNSTTFRCEESSTYTFSEKSTFHLNNSQQSSKQSHFVSNWYGQFRQKEGASEL